MADTTSTGTVTTPGGAGANLKVNRWKKGMEAALYDSQVFIPNLEETGEKVGNQLTLRRLSRVGIQTLSATSDGTDFDFQDLAPYTVNITPTWVLCATAYPDSMPRRMGDGDNIRADYAANLDDALAAGLDNLILQLVPSAQYYIGNNGYNIEAAGLRYGLGLVVTNTRRHVQPGDDINLLLDTGQISAALSIPEINFAYQRGDGKAPVVTGKQSTGYGLSFKFTTLLAQDGNGRHGAIFVRKAIQYGYNKRAEGEVQRYKKQTRIMSDAEIGGNIIYPEMIVGVRTA